MEDGCPPQGLTEATPFAQLFAPYPDETRRGDLSTQTSHAACAVLTTPFSGDALKTPRLYGVCLAHPVKVDEATSRANLGTAAMTSPPHAYAPRKGARLSRKQACISPPRESPNCFVHEYTLRLCSRDG